MPDPVLSSVAAAVAGKAAELAVQGGKNACTALVRLIRDRLGQDKDAAAALKTAQGDPQDQPAVARLAAELERIAAADSPFVARIQELWPGVVTELAADDDGVINSATGSVGGHLLQARDLHIQGGLHLGDIQRSSEP